MKSNQVGLVCCLVLAVATFLILFVESKRPVYVDITITEINEKIKKELCDASTYSGREEEEQEEKDKNKKEAHYLKETAHN